MSFFTFSMVLILVLSLVLYSIVTSKVISYGRRYNLPEIKYTKLFGVFAKRHFVYFYSLFALGQIIFTIWFLITL